MHSEDDELLNVLLKMAIVCSELVFEVAGVGDLVFENGAFSKLCC